METEITIENLQQENAELKIKVEAYEAEIEQLKSDKEKEENNVKFWESMYTDKVKQKDRLQGLLNTLTLMLRASLEFGMAKGQIELILKTIQLFEYDEQHKIA